MRLALFQPAIPQNVGASIRLSACFGVELHVIEPTGFRFDDRAMKRGADQSCRGLPVGIGAKDG